VTSRLDARPRSQAVTSSSQTTFGLFGVSLSARRLAIGQRAKLRTSEHMKRTQWLWCAAGLLALMVGLLVEGVSVASAFVIWRAVSVPAHDVDHDVDDQQQVGQ
jgi:hypothetical protein